MTKLYRSMIISAAAMSLMVPQIAQMQQAKAATPKLPATPAAPAAVPAAPAAPAAPVTGQVASPIGTQAAPGQLPYTIEVGTAPPERTRAFGGGGGQPSPFATLFADMPEPEGDNYAQVFIPIADVASSITDPAEREKAGKDASRKLVNNLGSIARRVKKGDPTFNTTMREVVENGQRGVRVWRIAPAAAEAPVTA